MIDADELRQAREAAEASARYRNPRGTTDRSITNINRWRAANPDALRTWTTTYGCVVAFWGMRVYYGTCQSCGELATARRPMAYHGSTGRWPKNCPDCQLRKAEDHADQARYRMRRVRGQYSHVRPRYDLIRHGSLVRPDYLSVVRKRLGINCLECGEPIRIVAHRQASDTLG
jgi:hypothetical protein